MGMLSFIGFLLFTAAIVLAALYFRWANLGKPSGDFKSWLEERWHERTFLRGNEDEHPNRIKSSNLRSQAPPAPGHHEELDVSAKTREEELEKLRKMLEDS